MTSLQLATLHKVTARHLQLQAMLYVRQSTLHQVFENTESTARQYALRERATALGWEASRIVVIDQDLGQSGASAADREGFQRLVAEVGLGRVGLEVSRLARSSLDWHHLLEMCAMTGTLILDEDGLYDPATFNDRLLLGLKGTMSEAELHVLRARLRGGILNKASRAALKLPLPLGLAYAEDDTVILDPDAQIRAAVGLLFTTFKRTGSATATVKYFRAQGVLFPHRVRTGPHKGEVHWGPLHHSTTLKILRNPRYAGAFCGWRARAPPNILTGCPIRWSSRGSNGSFFCRVLTLDISLGKNMKQISSNCSRIVPPTEKIAATVLRGKGQPCSRDWSSVGGVGIA